MTLHDWSLFPPLSLPAEIVLTKGRGRGGVVGGGDVCAALLSLGEGERKRGREKGAGGRARGCRREGYGPRGEYKAHTHTRAGRRTHFYVGSTAIVCISISVDILSELNQSGGKTPRHDLVSKAFCSFLATLTMCLVPFAFVISIALSALYCGTHLLSKSNPYVN